MTLNFFIVFVGRCFGEESVMTLLEPERLMMAVQSGNSVFPAGSILPQVS